MASYDVFGNPSCGPGSSAYQTIPANSGSVRSFGHGAGTGLSAVQLVNGVIYPSGNYPVALWNNATVAINAASSVWSGVGSVNFTFTVRYKDRNEVEHTTTFPFTASNSPGGVFALPNLPADAYALLEVSFSGTVTDGSVGDGKTYAGEIRFPATPIQNGPNNGDVSCPVTNLTTSQKILNTPVSITTGEQVEWTIRVRNTGTIAANGVTVSDLVPLAFGNVTWSCPGAVPASGSGNTISVTIPTINVGQFKDVKVTATALQNGTWINQARITDAYNDVTVSSLAVTVGIPNPPVLTKTATAAASPGSPVQFIVTVTNYQGTNFAVVRDQIPNWVSGATWTAAYTGAASGPIGGAGDLNHNVQFTGNGTAVFTINGTVGLNVSAGQNYNSATANFSYGQSPDPVVTSTNISIPVEACDVSVIVTAAQSETAPGETQQWSVLVSNNGPGNSNPVVTIEKPTWASSMTFSAPLHNGGASGGVGGSGALNQQISVPSGGLSRYTIVTTMDERYRFAAADIAASISTTCIPSDPTALESLATVPVRLPVGDGPKQPPLLPENVNNRYGCVADTCSAKTSYIWDATKGTRCLSTTVRVWTPSNPQPNNAKDVYNALHCHQDNFCSRDDYTNAGMAVNVRASSCIDLKVRNDVNGVPAIEASPIFFSPPAYDASSEADLNSCKPGFNVLSCVSARIDPNTGETLRGGISALFKGTETIRFTTTTDDSCGLNYKVTRAELIVNPCANNFINIGKKGISALVGVARTEDCIELYVEADDSPCEDDSTSRVVRARPKLAEDRGDYLNTLSCSSTGFASFFKTSDCFQLMLETVGVGNDRVFKIEPILAEDEEDPADCGIVNTLSCGRNGFASYTQSSDCMTVALKTVGGRKVIQYTPKFAESYSDGERQIIQGTSCTQTGMGTFFGETNCFRFISDTGGQGGHPIVRGELKLAEDISDQSFNGMSCTAQGASVFFDQFGECIRFFKNTTASGATSVKGVLKISALENNFAQCTTTCANGADSSDASGLFVGFNTESKCMTWRVHVDPCGRKVLDGCIKLDTSYGECNGLVSTGNGYWAPTDVRTGEAYVVGQIDGAFTASGSHTINLTLTNCDPCRSAKWFYDIQSASALVDTPASGTAWLYYTGTVGSGPYGQENYAGQTMTDATIQYPGMSQSGVAGLGPGQSITITLTVGCRITGTASVDFSDFRISAVMVPGSMTTGPVGGAAIGKECNTISLSPNSAAAATLGTSANTPVGSTTTWTGTVTNGQQRASGQTSGR